MSKEVVGKEAVGSRKSIQELQDELRSLIAQSEYLRNQVDAVNDTIRDLAEAIEVLEYVKEKGAGKVVLVPIGAGNFIKAKIESTESVIMGVGGRLSIEVSIDEAKKSLEERIKVLEELRLDLLRKLEEINRRINELIPKVREVQEG